MLQIIDEPTEEIVFRLEEITELSDLAGWWRELETRADASFFQSWYWLGCWLREAEVTPYILAGRQNGRIVVLGLLQHSRQRRNLIVVSNSLLLHHVGEKEKDSVAIEYNGFLIDRDIAARALGGCVHFLFDGEAMLVGSPDELHLKGVPHPYEQCTLPPGVRPVLMSRHPSWNIDLDGIRASGRGYLEHLSANIRYQIRRSIRLYEKHGPLIAERARSVEEALVFFRAMRELHQIYWSMRGQPGSFAHPFFERFHLQLIESCISAKTVEIVRIAAGPHLIGYLYNFIYNGWVLAYQSGFAYDNDSKLKPGLVSHYLCANQHLDDGHHVYDFMAGKSRYKSDLGTPGPDILDLVLQRSNPTLRFENLLRELKRSIVRKIRKR